MTCHEIRTALLEGERTERVDRHLAACADCRRAVASLESVGRALGDPMTWESPSVETRQRVIRSTSGAPSEEPGPTRRRLLAVAMVATVVLVAGTVTGLRIAAPDWEVTVAGTGLAPGLEGTVRGWNSDGGSKIEVAMSGLRPAPAGQVYELWFSQGDRHVSAGTFVTPDDVELWVGVRRADFPRVWITLEPLDSDPGPSKQVVAEDLAHLAEDAVDWSTPAG